MSNQYRLDSAQLRLDASESAFFERQLESIDARTYETKFEALKARQLLPTVSNVADFQKVYTYRMTEQYGTAKPIANAADDLPRADINGTETSQLIKDFGASYGWDYKELRAAMALGTDLDGAKARAAKFAIDSALDSVLATGDSSLGLKGLLNLANTQTYTLGTKAQSGDTEWGTLAAPVATADEVARDLMGFATALVEGCKEVWTVFDIVLPLSSYNYAAQLRFGQGSDMTALKFAQANCPYIGKITPWTKCNTAGGSSSKRMCGYANDEMVLAALVPQEFMIHPVERKNLSYVVNCTASVGGVVCRYPVAVGYADEL